MKTYAVALAVKTLWADGHEQITASVNILLATNSEAAEAETINESVRLMESHPEIEQGWTLHYSSLEIPSSRLMEWAEAAK